MIHAAVAVGGTSAAGIAAVILGSSVATAITIGVAAGGVGALNTLRDGYKIVENDKEHITLKRKKLIYRIKPPCPECPYTLGLVHTFANPCPTCRENGYRMFEQFQKTVRKCGEKDVSLKQQGGDEP